ncbi:exochitinase [Diaporthe helianthi]|uniref:Beta-hexosaminidase n=1 Tax=Diaporthe helianthi TaxID=158607 RepID=A0A2P5HGC3_DIAHE|nr:exochitinase [Diaporthe helianthi]
MASWLILPFLVVLDLIAAQGLGGLWPVPQPTFNSGNTPLFINKDVKVTYNGESLTLEANNEPASLASSDITAAAVSRAMNNIFNRNFVPWVLVPRNSLSRYEPALNTSATPVSCLEITLDAGNSTFDPTTTDVDEGYSLTIGEDGIAKLSSRSTFGVLHGLETFTQLFYEHSAGDAWYLVNAPIEIEDSPVYAHRGLMLDTARHWFPVADIKRTIDGLSYNKLNKLHVHVTDSQSWPLEITSIPELTATGAYSPSSVYSPDDIKAIQEYGVARGVEVYFEIDMPGHIGVVGEAFPDLVVAYDARPYFFYCAQPPCGAFRLNDSNVEDFLGNLFDDILPRVAPYSKYWGTGGDELNANDSRFDPGLNTNDSAVLQPLLQTFVDNQHTRVRNAGLIPTVWEELVTEWNVTLGKDVVVQSWLGGGAVAEIASKGHKVIDSNYNFWYLDCGRGQWLTFGNEIWAQFMPFNDWCGPAKSWELIYSHDPAEGLSGTEAELVLGGEVAVWSETIDSNNLDTLVWPRAAAAGEVLWSGRTDASGQNRSQVTAAPRLNAQRERLVSRGIRASPIQMEWCLQYPNATGCEYPAA